MRQLNKKLSKKFKPLFILAAIILPISIFIRISESNTIKNDIINNSVETSTELEGKIKELAISSETKLTYIATDYSESEGITAIYSTMKTKNDETKVNDLLNKISELIKGNETISRMTIIFEDLYKDNKPYFLIAKLYTDGNISLDPTKEYNSKRNKWINLQISPTNGSNYTFNELIKKNLNDPSSFEHIETTFRDIANEDIKNEINAKFEELGFSLKVEVGDLYLVTTFSAKNAFGGRVSNTAIGVLHHKNDSVTLVHIG